MITLRAPAKVNLYLEVIGKRPDGYHGIESIMQTVSLYDTITLRPAPDRQLSLTCSDPALPVDARNLAMKAAIALKEYLKTPLGARIHLRKNIPLGAGLGGGSSDAASVLSGLLRLWKKNIPEKALFFLAKELGADVPFFLMRGTCIARGIGEKLTPLPGLKRTYFLLVNPGFGVPTAGVYKNLRFPLTNKQKITTMKHLLETGSSSREWEKHVFNRLEDVVMPQYPGIRQIKRTLEQFGCQALMSGSGATVFGIVSSLKEGEKVKSALLKRGWRAWVTRAVS